MAELSIVFENEHLVAVDKPAGWLTVPSRFESEDPRRVLGRELEARFDSRLFPIHRLDQEVSGLVLFARTAEMQRRATTWFERRQVRKVYQALSAVRDFSHWPANLRCADEPISEGVAVEWRCKLLRGKRRAYEHPKGDPAVTVAQCLGAGEDGCLRWVLSPLTGRAHQLRFEMSRHGFPILGDELYGSREPWSVGIALRAVRLEFEGIPADDRKGLPDRLAVKGLFE